MLAEHQGSIMGAMAADAGELLRFRVLGQDAVYRVLEERATTVEVEVVDVPGLPTGLRLNLAAEAVAALRRRRGQRRFRR